MYVGLLRFPVGKNEIRDKISLPSSASLWIFGYPPKILGEIVAWWFSFQAWLLGLRGFCGALDVQALIPCGPFTVSFGISRVFGNSHTVWLAPRYSSEVPLHSPRKASVWCFGGAALFAGGHISMVHFHGGTRASTRFRRRRVTSHQTVRKFARATASLFLRTKWSHSAGLTSEAMLPASVTCPNLAPIVELM